MNEIIMVFISILLAFVLGIVGVLFIGHKFLLHYMIAKMSRGKKILVWILTPFGLQTTTATKETTQFKWKYDGEKYTTPIPDRSYLALFGKSWVGIVDIEHPELLIKPEKNILKSVDFDFITFRNILQREQTAPTLGDLHQLKKIIYATLFLVVGVIIACVMIYVKLSDVTKIATGGVL